MKKILKEKKWKCQNPKCNAEYAEYVNGCPKCATAKVGGSYSVRAINPKTV